MAWGEGKAKEEEEEEEERRGGHEGERDQWKEYEWKEGGEKKEEGAQSDGHGRL